MSELLMDAPAAGAQASGEVVLRLSGVVKTFPG